MRKILLFGGSFDPIHNGHISLCENAYKTINADYCYFILAKNPRWKEPDSNPKDRLNMLKVALKGKKKFRINLYEYNSKDEVTYTYNTMVSLKKSIKGELYYLIGADQLEKLDKWYKIDELSKMVNFLVYRRNGYILNVDNIKRFNCQVVESKEINMSSTDLRNLKNLNIPRKVLDYIEDNKLYYYDKLTKYIPEKRLRHSFSVARLSYDIALNNKLDALKAYHAGLIHDIAKGLSDEESLKIMKEFYPQYVDKIGKWGYHQFIGVKIAQDEFKIQDSEILEAIKYHATGNKNMTSLAMVIYSADKLDPTRGWDSRKLIKDCKNDYKQGFINVLKDNIKYFKDNNIDFNNELSDSCVSYYLNKE